MSALAAVMSNAPLLSLPIRITCELTSSTIGKEEVLR